MNKRLYALQVMRAYAAGMVVFIHAWTTYFTKVGGFSEALGGTHIGEIAVKLFFCISGFIIYSSSAELPAGARSTGLFWFRRIIRVAPIYWLATIVYSAKLYAQGIVVSPGEVLRSFFFIPYQVSNGLMRPILGQGWTLNYEMFFYLVFGVSLLFIKRVRIPFIVVVLSALIFLRVNDFIGVGPSGWKTGLYLLSFEYLAYFMLGLLLAWGKKASFFDKQFLALKPSQAIVMSCAIVSLYLYLDICFPLDGWPAELLSFVTCLLAMCACLLESPAKAAPQGRVSSALQAAGDGSYSTYLIHGFVMGPAGRIVSYFHLPVSLLAFAIGMVILCSFAGSCVYKWVERPILRTFNPKPGRLKAA